MVAALFPTGTGTHILVDRAVVLIGRGADCDAVIDLSSKISRMHCILVQVDTNYYIRDLASMNGVWINGKRVNKTAKLNQGDTVAIGDVGFQFHVNVQLPPRVAVRTQGGGKRMPALIDDSVQVPDVEIIEDCEIVDDVEIIDEVEIIEEVEVVDDIVEVVEAIDAFEIVNDIEVIDDEEVIENLQILSNEVSRPRRPRRPPRLR